MMASRGKGTTEETEDKTLERLCEKQIMCIKNFDNNWGVRVSRMKFYSIDSVL